MFLAANIDLEARLDASDYFRTTACYKTLGSSILIIVRNRIKVQRLPSVKLITPFIVQGNAHLEGRNKDLVAQNQGGIDDGRERY